VHSLKNPATDDTMFLDAINDDVKSLLFGTFPDVLKTHAGFYLAGGTALALHVGHRKSIDLDLFSMEKFSEDEISLYLTQLGGKISVVEEGTIHAFVRGVKVSFLYYPYPLLKSPQRYEAIDIARIEDIACMKIIAVSQRAEKKDFFDLYEILQLFAPSEIGAMVLEKYGRNRINYIHILKSFFYFDEAEKSFEPVSLRGVSWEKVKAYLIENESRITESFWQL
jgi:hypothetical protein